MERQYHNNGRERSTEPVKKFDTFIHMQLNNGYNYWEIELPTGYYRVSIVVGDPDYFDSFNAISLEGQLVVYEPVYSVKRHGYGTDTVYVSDGKLTIRPATGSGATNSKIDFIHITPVTVNNTTAVVLPFDKTGMIVYPNPTTTELTVSNIKEELTIRLHDIKGSEVLEHTNIQPGTFTFSTENLNEGIYFIEISGAASKTYNKIIVE